MSQLGARAAQTTPSLARRLEEAGYRLTAPRQAVVRALEAAQGHPNPAEVLEEGRRHCASLSRPTVYRTLDLLTRVGAVRPLALGAGGRRFSLTQGGHHHLVCGGCGSVVEFQGPRIDAIGSDAGARHGFLVGGHLLEVYGLCAQCR